MSDIKPLEVVPPITEPLKADETPVPVQEVPALETTPATNETTTETAPVAVEEDKKEEETKPEPKVISEGFLEFKPPGFFHSIIPSKRFFYLGDEAITEQNLEVYRKKDKGDHAASNAAFASQTGKGLLLFAKTKDLKATPAGIFRLDRATEVVTGTSAGKFTVKFGTNGDIHFESIPASDRDSWVSTLKANIEEAKAAAPAIEESEGYKTALEKFAKPTSGSAKVAAAVTSDKGKEKEVAKEESKEESEAVKEIKEDKKEKVKKEKKEKKDKDDDSSSSSSSDDDEDKKSKKSEKVKRSASKSKKRTSLFGFPSFKKEKDEKKDDKKDEKKDEKKEDAKVDEEKSEDAPKAADADLVAAGAAPLATEPVTVAEEPKPAEEVKAVEEPKVDDDKKDEAPKPTKRHSIFSFLDKKDKPATEKKVDEPKVEDVKAEETETAKEAPAAEPVAVTEPVVAPVEATPATVEEVKPEETKATPASPPKQSFLDKLFKPKEKTEKATGVAAPKEAAPEIAPEVVASEPAPVAETAPVVEAAPATEAAPVEPKEETTAEATATSPKEKRKSSFFSLGKKKESTSDNEEAKSPTSPLPKLSSFLSRKTSKSVKEDKKEEASAAAPETVAEESAAPTTEEAKKEEAAPVVPEVGSSTAPVQAAA